MLELEGCTTAATKLCMLYVVKWKETKTFLFQFARAIQSNCEESIQRNLLLSSRKCLKNVGNNLLEVIYKNGGYIEKCFLSISKISVKNVGECIDINE